MKINIFGDECMSVEKRTPISVKAINRIMKQHVEVKNINVNLDESLGHILAEDIVATYDIPRFNKSPYDGFAIRSEDSQGASGENRIEFEVIDHIGAGSVSEKQLIKPSNTNNDWCSDSFWS